jgi:hypothetical protein
MDDDLHQRIVVGVTRMEYIGEEFLRLREVCEAAHVKRLLFRRAVGTVAGLALASALSARQFIEPCLIDASRGERWLFDARLTRRA